MAADLTRRERLEALRDALAGVLGSGEIAPRDYAALSREYRATLAELAALPETKEVSAADEIAERRSRRRQASTNRKARSEGS